MENITQMVLAATTHIMENLTSDSLISSSPTAEDNSTAIESPRTNIKVSGRSLGVYHKVFNVYLQWPVVCIGVIANILTIVIMQKKVFRSLTMSVYFSALAVTDCIVLLASAFNQSLKETDGIRMFSLSRTCSSVGFLIRFGGGSSSWIIVIVAVERLLVVAFPLKAKVWTSKLKAQITTTAIIIAIFIMTSYNFWMVDYSKEKCIYLKPFLHFSKYGKGFYGLFLFGIIPFMIVSVCYTAVVVLMIARKKIRKELVARNIDAQRHEKQVEHVTAMCSAICLAFLVLYTPSQIYILVARMKGWVMKPPEAARAVETLLFFMKQLNYATNFFINLVSNKQFNTATVRLFTKRGRQVGPDSYSQRQSTTTT